MVFNNISTGHRPCQQFCTEFELESWSECGVVPGLLVCWLLCIAFEVLSLLVPVSLQLSIAAAILSCLFCVVSIAALHRIHGILILK